MQTASTPRDRRTHPLHDFTGRLHTRLDSLDSGSVWSLTGDELAESLTELYAAEARLAELKAALILQAETTDLAAREGAVNLSAWLREQMRLSPSVARGEVRFARMLAAHQPTRTALARGVVSVAQARVITTAVDQLPRSVTTDLKLTAEQHLITEAGAHHSRDLAVLGDRLLEVVDPDHADQRLAEQLEQQEAKALRESFLDLWHDERAGTTELHGRIPLLQGVKLARMVDALANPARVGAPVVEQRAQRVSVETSEPSLVQGPGHVTASERRGNAFVELLDRLPLNILPALGKNNATVVVTMTLDTLTGGLQAAGFDTGSAHGRLMSPSLARRLAAEAGIIPAVLGTKSEVLDLGRKARFFSGKQRLAMRIQQHGVCGAEGCDRPAAWAQANHLHQWQHHGPTDLTNGILLCTRHHTLADHRDYLVEQLSPARIRIRKKRPGTG